MSRKRTARKGARARRATAHRRRPLGVSPGLLLVLALCAGFVVHAWILRFTQDDAYISLRYAKNLVDGYGLVFNPGERVEGYSNFSWTLLLALLMKLGAPPVPTATWLGILFGAGAVFFAARLARALEGGWGPASVIAAGLVAGTSAFALWSTGGLETAMFAFLVTAGIERGLAPGVSARGRMAAPVLLCLAALTRPDGPLLFVLWFVVRGADTLVLHGPAAHERGGRGLLRDALLFAAPLVPYAAWKLVYYGDLLPNTFYAKAGTSAAYVKRGIEYALDYFHAYAAWGVIPLLALGSLAREGLRSVEARLLFVWCGYAAYIVVVGGDVLYLHRFWHGILPIGCVLLARGVVALGERVSRSVGGGRPAWRTALAAGMAVAIVGSGLVRNWKPLQQRRQTEIGFVTNMTQTGQWLGANLPRDSEIAITTIGAIGYYSGLRVIDMLGLTDREIARNPKLIDGLFDTWREIKYNAESVLRRRPDVILFSTGVRPSAAAEKALFLYESFFETYYAHYFRSVPNRTATQVAFRVRPDAPPFHATRVDVPGFEFLEEYSDGHLVQSRQHDYAAAAEHFARSWELSGRKFLWAREWQGAALYDGKLGGGLEILREVLERHPYSVVALLRIADRAMAEEDPREAERLFARILEFDPDDAVAWMGRAEAARRMGNPEAAFQYAREGILRCDAMPSYLMQLGALASQLGHLDVAEYCFRRASLIDPGFEPARQGMALVQSLRSGSPRPPAGGDPKTPGNEAERADRR